MLTTKDSEAFLRNFAGLARMLIAVPISQGNGFAPDALAAVARRIGLTAQSAPGIEEALAAIDAMEVAPPPRILVTGSLYLAGEVLAANGTAPG